MDYDTLGTLIDSSADYFSYLQDKTIYKYVSNEFGTLDSLQYTYFYDQTNRVTKLNLDYTTNPYDEDIQSMLFTYSGTNAARVDIVYGSGNTWRNDITYSNGSKTITLYDTMVLPAQLEPCITYYYLGTNNRIDSVKETWKNIGFPIYYDTTYTRLSYDAQNNLTRYYDNSVITHSYPSGSYWVSSYDSIIVQNRETRGTEIGKTLNKILANMAWYPLFAEAALYNFGEYYLYAQYPAITAKRWTTYYGFSSDLKLYIGNFVNTFNSSNLLIQQEIPGGFGNKYGGKASLRFSYIKLPH